MIINHYIFKMEQTAKQTIDGSFHSPPPPPLQKKKKHVRNMG